MSKAVFDSLEEAKTAFSLGPVKFRCNVCGGWHASSKRGWKYCLWELIEDFDNESLYTFPELKKLLSERWLPPVWLLPGVETICQQLQEVCNKLEAHSKSFKLSGWLKIDGSSFEILSLSKQALSNLVEGAKYRIQKKIIDPYESKHREEVEKLKNQYIELKRRLEDENADIKSFIGAEAAHQIDGITDMLMGLFDIRGIWYPQKLIVNDFLRVFPELERPYGIKGPQERFRSLSYAPRRLTFRDEGLYCILEARFVRLYSPYDRPRKRHEFHVLHIKDYREPVYIGVVEKFYDGRSIERVIKNARPRTED